MRNTTVEKVGKGRPRKHKLSMLTVKKAISRFISKTEKIVRSVKPEATIVMTSETIKKKTGRPPHKKTEELKPSKKSQISEKPIPVKENIITPQFRGKPYVARNLTLRDFR